MSFTRRSMAKKSTRKEEFDARLTALARKIPEKYYHILVRFFDGYQKAVPSFDDSMPILLLFIQLIEEQFLHPYLFAPYHQKVRHPIDYYRFGIDFVRPLCDLSHSHVFGVEQLD